MANVFAESLEDAEVRESVIAYLKNLALENPGEFVKLLVCYYPQLLSKGETPAPPEFELIEKPTPEDEAALMESATKAKDEQ